MPITLSQDYIEVAFAPCPFCGETPNVFQVPDPRYGAGAISWVVECKQMGCMFRRSSPDQSLTHLAEDWNRRLEPR